jgi:uncharacterized membrane protein YgcG
MNRLIAVGALALGSLALALPAVARDFVTDTAGMFSAGTVAALNQRISNFNSATGKEVVVMTTPSLAGATIASAAQAAFAQQNVNGVLIFIARDDRKDIIVPDRAGAQAGWFTPDVLRGIRQSMEALFKSGNYDGGVTAGVDGVLNIYRAHQGTVRAGAGSPANTSSGSNPLSFLGLQGVHFGMFTWLIIGVVGFFIVRAIIRAISGPRYYGGGQMPGAPMGGPPMGGGMGYGGPGYYGGGGGGFMTGLLGGLGGAWLGNELFGGNRGADAATPGAAAGGAGVDPNAGGGWTSDAGQADMSGANGGDWSGGGFGGDSGGGFGGDSGGGGGDSGGGW